MSKRPADDDRRDEHLVAVDDGCGCVEVWEALSEHRQEQSTAEE